MVKRIVFLGNCQMDVIRSLYDRFVGGITCDETFFLPAWTSLDDEGKAVLGNADLLVDQVQSFSREIDLPPGLVGLRRVPVPLVSASFLWPFAGSAHPSNRDSPFLKGGPYPGELGDGFLNRMIAAGVSPDQALEQYRQHDLGGAGSLDRRYELIIEQQRMRDHACDFAIADEIERHRREPGLFLSPHHPGLRISVALASQCLHRIGVPQRSIDMLTGDVRQSPFPKDELPIHPRAASHFGLDHIRPDTTFEWRGEGRFTWAEWVMRYMTYAWSPALFEGWSIASGNPTRARALLTAVIETLPGSPLAHSGLAKAFLAMDEFEAAAAHSATAVALSPGEAEFARTAAFIASALQRPAEAATFAQQAAMMDAGNVANLQLLAKQQEEAGDFTAAEETRRKAVALRPTDAGLLTDLGTTLSHLKKFDEALACYQLACELAPNQAGPHFGTSTVLAQLGRTEEAIQAVETALRLRPGVGAYFSHLGHLLLRVGRRDAAIPAFQSALESDPKNAGLHALLADQFLQDHLSKAGFYHAMCAADCAPNVVRYQVRVAHLLTRHIRLVEAIEAYRRAILLAPDDWRLHAELGAIFVRLDRLEEAVAELTLASEIERSTAQVRLDLANVLMRMGRFTDAESAIDRAIRLAPDDQSFWDVKAELKEILAGRRYAAVGSRHLASHSTVIVDSDEFVAPKCTAFTNFPDMNPSFGAHHVNELYVEKRRWVPDVRLCQMPEHARLAVPNGEEFLPLIGNRIVAEQIRPNWPYEKIVESIDACVEHVSITEPAVLIGRYGVRTWGHWLGELLPKVVAVESRWPGRFRYILPDRFGYDGVHKTAVESLAYYGIEQDRLILVAPKTMYAFSSLYCVTATWSAERMFHPAIASLMRELGPREIEPATGWLKAALLRRAVRTRNIQNLQEVEAVLLAHGFAMIDIEKMNFRQQVDLFKNANAIACVLGSGLTGVMYAPRGVKVLTMAPGEWGDLFFYSMMQERDAVYSDIRGRTAAADSSGVGTSGFTVPIEALRTGVTAIGLRNEHGIHEGK